MTSSKGTKIFLNGLLLLDKKIFKICTGPSLFNIKSLLCYFMFHCSFSILLDEKENAVKHHLVDQPLLVFTYRILLPLPILLRKMIVMRLQLDHLQIFCLIHHHPWAIAIPSREIINTWSVIIWNYLAVYLIHLVSSTCLWIRKPTIMILLKMSFMAEM